MGKPLPVEPDGVVFLNTAGVLNSQELVGSLMYLVNTIRWDISYAVMVLARGMPAPTEDRIPAAKRVLHYHRGTQDLPTVYHKGESCFLTVLTAVILQQ